MMMKKNNIFEPFERAMSKGKKTTKKSTLFEIKIVETSEKQIITAIYEGSREVEIAEIMANFLNKNKTIAALLATYVELSKTK